MFAVPWAQVNGDEWVVNGNQHVVNTDEWGLMGTMSQKTGKPGGRLGGVPVTKCAHSVHIAILAKIR